MCGASLLTLPSNSRRIWIGAVVQIAMATTFMLLFHFPKFMIVAFVALILVGTAASAWIKTKASRVVPAAPPPPLAHPALFRIVISATVLCAFTLVASALFGFVAFMNSWNRWHQYEGQPYHQSDFVVTQVYFQKHNKGVDAYASGTVEGQREWMNLIPYLRVAPRSQAQLDSMVGPGITIPIFYFPELKGRVRVQFDDGVPPAEQGHRGAMNALKYGFLGIVVSAGMILVLSRVRSLCYVRDPAFPEIRTGQPV